MRKTAFGLAFAAALSLALGACKRNSAVEPLASARADQPAAPSGPAHGGAQGEGEKGVRSTYFAALRLAG